MADFEKNTRLVYDVFNKKFQYARYLEDDLIQEGMMALYKACKDYKPEMNVEFSTYAYRCITNAMGCLMRKENKISGKCVSLSATVGPDTDITYEETAESDDYEDIQEECIFEQVMGIIQQEPQYIIIKKKLEGKTQAEIAKELGITQCSVSEQLRGLYERMRDKLGIPQPEKKTKKK